MLLAGGQWRWENARNMASRETTGNKPPVPTSTAPGPGRAITLSLGLFVPSECDCEGKHGYNNAERCISRHAML